MRWMLAAATCAAFLAAPPAEAAAPYSACQVIADPAGDTAGWVPVNDPDTDIRAVVIRPVLNGMFVWLDSAGRARDPEWVLTFTSSSGKRLFVSTAAGEGFVRPIDKTDRAGVWGGRAVPVRAVTEADGRLRVDVPYSAFGAAAPRRGTALLSFSVRTTAMPVDTGSVVLWTARDEAESARRLVVGWGC